MRRLNRGIAAFAFVALPIGLTAQSEPNRATVAERVVAEFYAWYVPMAGNDPGPHLRAIRERRGLFTNQLVAALRADAAATAQGGEEIDGLDADPFLNAQSACAQYRPIRTMTRGADYFVAVLGSGGCAAHSTPDVTVRVAWRNGHPVFVNFLYSSRRGDDLLALLHGMAVRRRANADREHSHGTQS